MNVDKQGNKKKIKSAVLRERRVILLRSHSNRANGSYCVVCGFRIRSAKHKSGGHHRRVAV